MEDNNICIPLPSSITKRINTHKNNEQYIANFLQNTLPASDSQFISDELRKTFILSKFKSKQRKRQKCKGKLLTNRKRMQLGLRQISTKHGMTYNSLVPLNQLWLKYMQQMLGKFYTNIPRDPIDPNWEIVNQQLIKADFHGAEISVIKSKCSSLIGLNGIVIQDTKNVFRICGTDNVVRTIPKDVIVLNIHLGKINLQVFGKEVSFKPVERTVKKVKTARAFEL